MMISVSIQELKQRLSELIRKATAGERVLITRHNKPVASLDSAQLRHVHVGQRFGKALLRPLLKNATRGAYLRVLREDRRGARTVPGTDCSHRQRDENIVPGTVRVSGSR